ncbi:hypothetical protein Tco_1033225 [Tanacetum coccineum]|uniref:Synaptobrevin, longin-like domain protein n=1 Tax=Tanacetum coccineum TaxID=301880 RepID=A0ABQ5GFR0_9ASTR
MTTLQLWLFTQFNRCLWLITHLKVEGFGTVVDFLNAHTIKYALTVNPTIYTSCIEQFWATVKVKTVNGEQQLQALVDGKKIVVTEASVRRDLQLDDEEGTDCLPNATIFEELTRMRYEKLSQKLTFYKAFFSPQWKFLIHTILQCLSAKTTAWNEFSSTMASAIICLATNQKFNFSKYIFESMVKNLDNAGKFLMYPRKDFSGRKTPLFPTMMVQAQQEHGEGSEVPTDPHHTPIITQPSSSQPQRKQKSRRPKEKDTQELMDFCTKLQQRVLDLENTKTAQSHEITSLKKRVKKLEKKGGSRTHKLKRLYRGRKIDDIDKDAEISLVDETHGRYGDEDMFGVNDLNGDEMVVEKRNIIKEAVVVTDAVIIPVSAATITNVELTLAQTLAELKSARPKTKGVKGQGSKDKRKEKMIEPEKLLKKKDQIKFNEEEALRLQAKFDEEDRLAREKAPTLLGMAFKQR